MADTLKQQLDEIGVQILSLQRQLRASMDRFQTLYNQVSGSGASAEQAAADALGYKTDAETAAGTCTEAVATVQGMIEGFSGNAEGTIAKIVDPVAGNVPTMTADGNLQTSVLALTDLAVKYPEGAGYFAVFDAEGGLTSSGFSPVNTMAKPAGAVTGNVATYGTAGAVVDSNVALTAFVRHDTAQSLSSAGKAQLCTNAGLAAPVAMLYPELATVANSTITATSAKFLCSSGGVSAGVLFSFKDRYSGGNASYPTYADVFAQLNGVADNDTFTLTLSRDGTSVMAVTVTRVSATSYTIGSVTVTGSPAPVRLAFTNEGTTGNYVSKLYVNGTLAATSNASANRTNRIAIATASLNSYAWVAYLPHLNYWTTGI